MDISSLSLRNLQRECARVLCVMQATSYELVKYNKESYHDSQNWYITVIQSYVDQYGDLPSKVGPAKDVKLFLDV